jgi:hypothetical protein
MVVTRTVLIHHPLSKIASAKKFLVAREKVSDARWASWFARNGCVLMAHLENGDEPEVLAVVALPSAAERRRREILLARLMLVMVDIVLAGDPLGLETARDLSREVRHTYPELVDEFVNL